MAKAAVATTSGNNGTTIVDRGRSWLERRFAPSRVADSVIGALAAVMSTR